MLSRVDKMTPAEEESLAARWKDLPTKQELRDAILCKAPYAFDRPAYKSFGYLAANLALAIALGWAAYAIGNGPIQHFGTGVRAAFWLCYAFAQGTVCTGLWVIGHECGHGAFSASDIVNDTVGLVLHSALLVPYHAWQHSHRLHHSRTNHADDGESHVPAKRGDPRGIGSLAMREALGPDAFAAVNIAKMLLIGWPVYLITNVSGSDKNSWRRGGMWADHFRPSSPLFPKGGQMTTRVIISDLALVAAIAAVCFSFPTAGDAFRLYFLPYLVVNAWLVGYTFLQHTDIDVPHMRAPAWTWLRGAVCTIDRNYGVFDIFHHHIGSTHVLHHIFHEIPHYHAKEASKAIIPLLGRHYLRDDGSILAAMWRTCRDCAVVEASDGTARTAVTYYTPK